MRLLVLFFTLMMIISLCGCSSMIPVNDYYNGVDDWDAFTADGAECEARATSAQAVRGPSFFSTFNAYNEQLDRCMFEEGYSRIGNCRFIQCQEGRKTIEQSEAEQ